MYERFLELLKESGLTVYQLCKETGILQSTLSNWKARVEAGDKDAGINIQTAKKICDYLNVPLEKLLG